MSNPTAVTEASDLMEVIVRALERAGEPIAATKLSKDLSGPFKMSPKRLEPLLGELVAAGRIHQFPPALGKAPRYWGYDHDRWTHQVMRQAVPDQGKTWSAWQTAVKSKLKGVTEERLRAIRDDLVRAHEVYEWPPPKGSRTAKFHVKPPDPRDYLRKPFMEITTLLEKAGVTRAQILEAARDLLAEPDVSEPRPVETSEPISEPAAHAAPEPAAAPPADGLAQQIIDRMHEINPEAASNALISLRDLWRSVQFLVRDKHAFDEAVQQLARDGRVALHHHDYPQGLSDEERADMIADGSGGFFVGVALRT